MARLASFVIPGLPHHVTQRGNRRGQTFFKDGAYGAYVELMADWCRQERVEIWAYCLMPNHVHLIAVPQTEQALRRAVGEAHRRSLRGGSTSAKTGQPTCGSRRLASLVMDESCLLAAARDVEPMPLRMPMQPGRPTGARFSQ